MKLSFALLALLSLISSFDLQAQTEPKVGVLDLRGRSERFVTMTTASVSSSKVVVLFRGDNTTLFNASREASQNVVNNGFEHLAGIVWADPDSDALNATDCIQIYFDGVPVTALLSASDPYMEEILQKAIIRAYDQYHEKDR